MIFFKGGSQEIEGRGLLELRSLRASSQKNTRYKERRKRDSERLGLTVQAVMRTVLLQPFPDPTPWEVPGAACSAKTLSCCL